MCPFSDKVLPDSKDKVDVPRVGTALEDHFPCCPNAVSSYLSRCGKCLYKVSIWQLRTEISLDAVKISKPDRDHVIMSDRPAGLRLRPSQAASVDSTARQQSNPLTARPQLILWELELLAPSSPHARWAQTLRLHAPTVCIAWSRISREIG